MKIISKEDIKKCIMLSLHNDSEGDPFWIADALEYFLLENVIDDLFELFNKEN